ncbi:TIGR03915 family putative DNA repair protein [Niveibacterium terrae]|uniref:TIGR03915 family putative DNA repair protein n=1 Tax=Niveibacterium terrae TaxID=3373598 RepID=UPI003A907DFE
MAEVRHSASVVDFAQWRSAARHFLAAGIAPDALVWNDGASSSLFDAGPSPTPGQPVTPLRTAAVSATLLDMMRLASNHDAADRWALFYRILWRWTRGERCCASAADVDGARLHQLTREVRHEVCHVMSFVRFRERSAPEGDPRYVAWIEPAYPVLREVADHFARRMGRISWMIASPRESVFGDGTRVVFGPGQQKLGAQTDPNEALWAVYYRSTFNPGRLNVDLMRGHMPERFWKNLPEAPQIEALVSATGLGTLRPTRR